MKIGAYLSGGPICGTTSTVDAGITYLVFPISLFTFTTIIHHTYIRAGRVTREGLIVFEHAGGRDCNKPPPPPPEFAFLP